MIPIAGAAACISAACASPGEPCGRAQFASADATLPDTGINAGTSVRISFRQHDPDLSGELSEVVIQHIVPLDLGLDPEPNPQVRLVTAAGRVLLDTVGTRSLPGNPSRTWTVLYWIHAADARNALFEAFRDSTLVLELRPVGAVAPGTRVKPQVKDVGVSPPMICL